MQQTLSKYLYSLSTRWQCSTAIKNQTLSMVTSYCVWWHSWTAHDCGLTAHEWLSTDCSEHRQYKTAAIVQLLCFPGCLLNRPFKLHVFSIPPTYMQLGLFSRKKTSLDNLHVFFSFYISSRCCTMGVLFPSQCVVYTAFKSHLV